ncbi:hypothetical protein [Porphyromonas sp.]
MDNNQAPLRGRAAEKEKVILTQEEIDEVVRLVMEEGYSMYGAAKIAVKCTENTFIRKFQGRYPELYAEVLKKSRSNARVRSVREDYGWDKTDYTNFWTLGEWKRRGLIKGVRIKGVTKKR